MRGPRAALAAAAAFARAEAASLTVETVFVFPFLIWALAAVHVFWDGYRMSTASLKATYTVSDLVSRKSTPLDQTYLDGMRAMLDALAGGGRAGGTARDGPAALRVSVVRNRIVSEDPRQTALTLAWSHAAGAMAEVTDLSEIEADLPALAPGDRIVVVETRVPWSPLADVGLTTRAFGNVAVTRPRFTGQVCWEACSPS